MSAVLSVHPPTAPTALTAASLSGTRYGLWLVLYVVPERGKSWNRYVRARCEGCGLEKNVVLTNLRSGRSKGCFTCASLAKRKTEEEKAPRRKAKGRPKVRPFTTPAPEVPSAAPIAQNAPWKRTRPARVFEPFEAGTRAVFKGEPREEIYRSHQRPERDPLYSGREGREVVVLSDSIEEGHVPVVIRFSDGFIGLAERSWLERTEAS